MSHSEVRRLRADKDEGATVWRPSELLELELTRSERRRRRSRKHHLDFQAWRTEREEYEERRHRRFESEPDFDYQGPFGD